MKSPMRRSKRTALTVAVLALSSLLTGCGEWRGLNSLPLPGTEGAGRDAYSVKIQMPNVTAIQQNSRVRVNDVDVGNISAIEREDWHALVTVSLNSDVELPGNAVAKLGQTSLLGSQHIELAAPIDRPATGRLKNGDLIPLDRAGQYPTTEETLAAISTVLNGSGLGQLQQITTEVNTALSGRETDVRNLIDQFDVFTDRLNQQKTNIVTAAEGLDHLASTVNRQNDVLAVALDKIPEAIVVLNKQSENLTQAVTAIGNFSDLGNRIVNTAQDDIVENLRNLQPALQGLADGGPDLTRSLGIYSTFPWPQPTIPKWVRGDYANLSATIDLTLGRLDNSLLQGTPMQGQLTALETALGRTVARQPGLGTPNPLTEPVPTDRGGR
ncbi:MCE family protein [Rhodococcus qingshengii]|uniref:MCE family protein n=1 Tax=Rhodococcus qingshengii TaxID=334542 RepID=UPI0024BA3E59|nr:MCE family protein [Rhodococcus qingshengii]MDJ0441102.1 MCE family protein [Rhodococcus qingshengii]